MKKMIVIVFGLPGSGKSYFASRLAHRLGALYINSDEVRLNMLRERTYSPEEKMLVYDAMLNNMTEAISSKKNIVLDATFYKESIRNKFNSAALGYGQRVIYIEITAPEDIIKKRVSQPRKDSEADYQVYLHLKKISEPLLADHLVLHSSDNNIVQMLDEASGYIKNHT